MRNIASYAVRREAPSTRPALRTLHAASSTLGLLFIGAFFVSTIAATIGGDLGVIRQVKAAIFYALFALVPLMAVAALSGERLAGGSRAPVVARKRRRTRLAALNAVAVLVPCVVVLHRLAGAGWGPVFAAVQAVELLAGAGNLVLLGLNLRDGLRLRRSRGRLPGPPGSTSAPAEALAPGPAR